MNSKLMIMFVMRTQIINYIRETHIIVKYNNYAILEKDEHIKIYLINYLLRLSHSTKSIERYFIFIRDKTLIIIESIYSEIRVNNQRKTFINMNKYYLDSLKQTFISFGEQQKEISNHS